MAKKSVAAIGVMIEFTMSCEELWKKAQALVKVVGDSSLRKAAMSCVFHGDVFFKNLLKSKMVSLT